MSTKDWIEKDYYKILDVPKDADADTVKKAYRKLARELHPDQNNDKDAEARFKDVSEAYAVLSNPDKRKEYDEARRLFGTGLRTPGGGTGTDGGFNFDLGDLFSTSTGSGGLGDVFGGIFGQRGRTRTTTARRGTDVETEVTIDFTDAVEGKTVPLKMTSSTACPSCAGTGARAGTVPRVCPTCTGTGYTSTDSGGFGMAEPCRDCKGRGMLIDDPCPDCHGSGRVRSSKVMHVRIPAGVADGQRIRLKGRGGPGDRGGPAGDLYVRVHVSPHKVFGRKGDNLTLTVPVTYPEAALGADIKVPTLNATSVTLKVPPGTPNGRTFRVRGRGVPRKDGSRGDLLVTVDVSVPSELDDRTREALEAMRKSSSGEDMRTKLMNEATRQ